MNLKQIKIYLPDHLVLGLDFFFTDKSVLKPNAPYYVPLNHIAKNLFFNNGISWHFSQVLKILSAL